ncbi:MAG: carboxymuconolactone decarboxylase family protein [Kiloniellaceae bacterium]
MAEPKDGPRIPLVDPHDADPATAALLRGRARKWGKSWNVARAIAIAPAVFEMMDRVWDCLARTSLSIADRELIAMEMAVTNGCHYCVPAHRYGARREARLDPDTVALLERVARGEALTAGTRLAVMQRLVRRLLVTHGGLTDGEFATFRSEGVTPRQMIETIAEIAHCTVTNYTNRLVRTPLDPFLEPYQ